MEYTDQIKICVKYVRIQERLVDSTRKHGSKKTSILAYFTQRNPDYYVFQSEQGYQFIFSLVMCFYSYPISKHLLKITRKKTSKHCP